MTTRRRSGQNPSEGAAAAKQKVGKSRESRSATKAPAKKLTTRQTKLLAGVLAGKSTRAAAIAAGYSENTADDHSKRLLNTQAMREALADKLIEVDEIAQHLNAGANAVETQTFSHVLRSKLKGTEEIRLKHVDKIAWSERRKYLELICRLKGVMPGEKIELEGEMEQHLVVEHIHLGGR